MLNSSHCVDTGNILNAAKSNILNKTPTVDHFQKWENMK